MCKKIRCLKVKMCQEYWLILDNADIGISKGFLSLFSLYVVYEP